MKTSLKDWPKVYEKLSRTRFAHDDERILFARFAAANPQERWEMNENYLRLNGCWGWQNRRRFAQLRKRLDDTTRPELWKQQLTNEEFRAPHSIFRI